MKPTYVHLAVLFLFVSGIAKAQTPVSWTYTAKQISPLVFELHILATMENGWHIYAQHQPAEAIAVPTAIHYVASPLLDFQGFTKEKGKLIHYTNDQIGVKQDQYGNTVDFIQIVKLKAKVTTDIRGSLVYQACTDKECLPAATVSFKIPLVIPVSSN